LKYVALQEINYVSPVSSGEKSFFKEEKKKILQTWKTVYPAKESADLGQSYKSSIPL